MSHGHHDPAISRRGVLGATASLFAASAFSLSMSGAAAPIENDNDDPVQTIASPDGSIELTLDIADGSPTYTVTHDGTTVIGESALGFDFQNQPALGSAIEVTGSERSTTDETWTPVWDQYDEIRNHHREMRVGLAETSGPGRSLTLAVRAFDDGIAVRYLFPDDSGLGQFVITDERTEFAFEADHTAWWIPNDYNSYEYGYSESALSEIGQNSSEGGAHTPITMRTESGRYLSVHEADLIDYAAMGVEPTDTATTLQTDLAPLPDGTKVTAEAPHRTPWRTVQVTERPGALVESSLILNCNPPRDPEQFPQGVDWIEPAKFIGIWWLMITGRAEWQYLGENTGNHGARTGRMKRYMEFASEHGISSVLVEGWNVGWDSYPGSGDTMDFDESYPDFDLEAVTNFGADLDPPVAMTAHNETAGNVPNYEAQLAEEPNHFARYDKLGINTIKTGYVADSGVTVDGRVHNHHCQPMVNHHHLVSREAARHRQMLEIHEPIKPTGERRRYPNVMTREGVFGQEYDAFGFVSPSHHVTVPFTRMLGGPVEYTPGIFDMDSGNGGIETTRAKQLAMYPTYLSGLHMAADLPGAYLQDQEPRGAVGEVLQAEWGDREAFGRGMRWPGAQADGYVTVDPGDEEGRVAWTIDSPSAGEYDLHLRYANGASGSERTLSVLTESSSEQVGFPATGHWNEWSTVSPTVSLPAGESTVALAVRSDDTGGLNVDALAVTEVGEPMPEPDEPPIRGPTIPAFQFIEDVPAAGWDDTRVIDAAIGEYTAVARKHGEEWYLGVMTGEAARVLDVPLDFLDGEFVTELYVDGPDASFDENLRDVHRSEATVDSETTLAASMVSSGGLAARIRPPEDGEAVAAYERPEQTLAVEIAERVRSGDRLVTATGDNPTRHVGGTIVEVLVDGEVVARSNVRLAPETTGATRTLPATISQGGAFEVEVRRVDGTTLASRSVTVVRPETVASFNDPGGDDTGSGSYTYPTGEAYRSGAFDLREFSVAQTDQEYIVRMGVGNLYNARDGDRGFSPHAFVFWIHDPAAGGGRRDSRDDLQASVGFERPWQYRLAVTPDGASVVADDGSTLATGEDVGTTVDRSSDLLTVRFDRSVLDGVDAGTLGMVGGVHAFVDGALAPVDTSAGPDTFGGASEGAVDSAPRLSDVLTEVLVSQSDILSAYSPESVAVLPFVPFPEGGLPEPTTTTTTTTTTTETTTTTTGAPDTTAPTTPTASGDGPGFGLLSGALGTAGGVAYAARRLLARAESDLSEEHATTTDEPADDGNEESTVASAR